MARVITFSRYFPKTHPKAGEPTRFVEKIWESIGEPSFDQVHGCVLGDFEPKHHTIRAGKRWKKGDEFSPRIWSGKPYCSPQMQFAPIMQIVETYDIDIFPTHEIFINGDYYGSFGSLNCEILANNDGLSIKDFQNWFKLPFSGQIICWKNPVYTCEKPSIGCPFDEQF